jgi:hypothetical protein
LPFLRLFIVFLIALTFAVGFAELVRQSDERRGDQAATNPCSDTAGACPEWGTERAD